RTPKNKDIKPFPIYNTGQSFKKFWEKLCRFKEDHMLDEVVIGFESTGPYAEPITNYLRKKPVNLVQVNPMHTKRIKELTGNSPNKTDKKDPRVIADVISLGHSLTVVMPEGAAAQLRRLTHARERAIGRRTAMNNQLQDLVFVIFPELGSIIKPSTKTGMYLIKNYPDPESIASIGIENLSDIIRRIGRGKFDKDRAEELYNAAEQSTGITEGKKSVILETSHLVSNIAKSVILETSHLVSNIANENRYIESLEEQMIEHLEQIPYSHSILSIKGIGHVTAAGLIGEVGNFNKFNTISEITKLAGLDLFEISSGQFKGQRRISKRGRPMMRKLLFSAAINMVKSTGIMHEKYKQMLGRGMLKMKALIAITRKILGIIFAIVRNNTVYIENYTKQNHYKLAA
ncbi:MAG: IS110 family transposase, partial [Deltaproteobacteria bacterium]|nr:IS110 family transposase [Deltaproteobacteria bacterium]